MFPNIYHQIHRTLMCYLCKRCSSSYKGSTLPDNSSWKSDASTESDNDVEPTSESVESIDDDKQPDKGTKKEFPEEPTTCCMSGCANCVWLDYAEEISEYFKDGGEAAMKEIEERVQDPNIKAFLLTELRMRMRQKK